MSNLKVRCPHCNNSLGFYTGKKDYGSPLKKCFYCDSEYIDNDYIELALYSRLDIIFEIFKGISFKLIKILLTASTLEIFLKIYYYPDYNIHFPIIFMLFIILLAVELSEKSWGLKPIINESIERLNDSDYQHKLYLGGIDIKGNSIYSIRKGAIIPIKSNKTIIPLNIITLLGAVLLFVGILELSSNYYFLLRVFISVISIYGVMKSIQISKFMTAIYFITLAIFSPLWKIGLNEDIWIYVHAILGFLFLFISFKQMKMLKNQ